MNMIQFADLFLRVNRYIFQRPLEQTGMSIPHLVSNIKFRFAKVGYFHRPVGSLVGAAVSIASLAVYFVYSNSLHISVNEDQLSAYILSHEAASHLV